MPARARVLWRWEAGAACWRTESREPSSAGAVQEALCYSGVDALFLLLCLEGGGKPVK